MIKVEMSFNSVAEAQVFFARIGQGGSAVPGEPTRMERVVPTAPPITTTTAAPPTPAPQTEKPKKIRGKDAPVAPAPKEEPIPVLKKDFDDGVGDALPENMQPTPEEAKAEAEREVKEEDVRNALKAVSGKFGLDAVREILSATTGKARISEVEPAQYAAVIAAANAKVAG